MQVTEGWAHPSAPGLWGMLGVRVLVGSAKTPKSGVTESGDAMELVLDDMCAVAMSVAPLETSFPVRKLTVEFPL